MSDYIPTSEDLELEAMIDNMSDEQLSAITEQMMEAARESEIDEEMDSLAESIIGEVMLEATGDTSNWRDLKTPEELLKWMDCIQYGYVTGSGVPIKWNDDDKQFDQMYRLQTPDQLAKSKHGVCWDQCELEREWFEKHHYKFQTYFIEIVGKNDTPSHTFLLYFDKGRVKWLEHSWHDMRGIHPYDSVQKALADIIRKYKSDHKDIKGDLFITQYKKPAENIKTMKQFMQHCIDSDAVYEESVAYDPMMESISVDDLPNVMYFGSPNKHEELKGKVFLSPLAGIASIFCVDTMAILRRYAIEELGHTISRNSVNFGYDEYTAPTPKLKKPLSTIHIKHNIPKFQRTTVGRSKGYIHVVDVSKVKDKLHQYKEQPIEREVYYESDEPLPIMRITEHEVKWTFSYDEERSYEFGDGFVEEIEFDEMVLAGDLPPRKYSMKEMAYHILFANDQSDVDLRGFVDYDESPLIDGLLKYADMINNMPFDPSQVDRHLLSYAMEDTIDAVLCKPMNINFEHLSVVDYDPDTDPVFDDWTSLHGYFESIYDDLDYLEEKSQGKLKYCFRLVKDAATKNLVKIVYELDPDKIELIGPQWDSASTQIAKKDKDGVQRKGHMNFAARLMPIRIVDVKTGKSLDKVTADGIMTSRVNGVEKHDPPITYEVGKLEPRSTYKSTSYFKHQPDKSLVFGGQVQSAIDKDGSARLVSSTGDHIGTVNTARGVKTSKIVQRDQKESMLSNDAYKNRARKLQRISDTIKDLDAKHLNSIQDAIRHNHNISTIHIHSIDKIKSIAFDIRKTINSVLGKASQRNMDDILARYNKLVGFIRSYNDDMRKTGNSDLCINVGGGTDTLRHT